MIYLICDANSLWARAYYAATKVKADPILAASRILVSLLNPNGERIGRRIDRMLLCWDGGSKSNKMRGPKPDDYISGIEKFSRVVESLFGGAQIRVESYEADDVVATATYRLSLNDVDEAYVCSGDHDLQQLQSGHVCYYCLNSGSILTRGYILNRWHVKKPNQICIALAILGDRGDGITGIKGWGAAKVKAVFSTVTDQMDLEEVLKHVRGQIPPEKLEDFDTSLSMTVLDPDVPNVPEPGPLRLEADSCVINDFGLDELSHSYLALVDSYGHDDGSLDRAMVDVLQNF